LPMKRKPPLGANPLDPETVLRDMVRGGRSRPPHAGDSPPPAIRKAPSTTTPGGLLRKTVYFTEAEWRAIKAKAYQEDRPYTAIVREAVKRLLTLPDEAGETRRDVAVD
jgi:hypothetical protein